jgi:hypothetical protein
MSADNVSAEDRQTELASLQADVTAASASFDKAISFLAGGALALSITFLHDIAPVPRHSGRLAVAWLALWIALIASMFSFIASDAASRSVIYKLQDGIQLSRDRWYYATLALNWLSAIGVVVGTGFLAYFAFGNLMGGQP